MITKWIMYISENQEWAQMIILSLIFIFVFLATIELSLLKRQVKGICKTVKKYFDVILQDEENSKEELEEAFVLAEPEGVPQIVKTSSKEAAEKHKIQSQKKQQEEAKLLMDVIQEVF